MDRKAVFIAERNRGAEPVDAALRAGYSPARAARQAEKLMADPKIASLITLPAAGDVTTYVAAPADAPRGGTEKSEGLPDREAVLRLLLQEATAAKDASQTGRLKALELLCRCLGLFGGEAGEGGPGRISFHITFQEAS